MSETKTYKNARVTWNGDGTDVYPSFEPGTVAHRLGTYSYTGWDMEVTFTRKPPPISVGDRVRLITKGLANVGTVLGFHEKWAWVRWDGGAFPASPLKENLKHAEDDNCD